MKFRSSVWFACISFVIATVCALGTVQDEFQNPVLPDASVQLTQGEVFKIQWTSRLYAAFAIYAPSANVSDVDLYITGTNYQNISHLIQDEELSITNLYTFRYMPAGRKYTGIQDEQISSPGVVVNPGPGSALSTSGTTSGNESPSTTLVIKTATRYPSYVAISTSSATGTTTNIGTTSTTVLPSGTSNAGNDKDASTQNSSASGSSGLAGASIAGIVIGVVFGVALIISIIWLIARLMRQQPGSASGSPTAIMSSAYPSLPRGTPEYYVQKSWLSQGPAIPPPSYGNRYQARKYAELPILNQNPRAQLP